MSNQSTGAIGSFVLRISKPKDLIASCHLAASANVAYARCATENHSHFQAVKIHCFKQIHSIKSDCGEIMHSLGLQTWDSPTPEHLSYDSSLLN